MSIFVLRLIAATGFIFSIAAIASFLTSVYFLGISPLIYEGLGVTVFGFVCGYCGYSKIVWCALAGAIIAVILDSTIWELLSAPTPWDMNFFSAQLNGTLFIVFIISYGTGDILKRRNC